MDLVGLTRTAIARRVPLAGGVRGERFRPAGIPTRSVIDAVDYQGPSAGIVYATLFLDFT